MSCPSLDLRTNKHSFGTPKVNVQIICTDDAGAEHTFDADGYILRAASGRFQKLLEGVCLSKHNIKQPKTATTPDDHSTSSQRPASTPPAPPRAAYALVVKDTAQRMLLLLQLLHYAPLAPSLPSNRTFSAGELLTLLDLADAYKLKECARATLNHYIARSAAALAMQVADYADFNVLVQLMLAARCTALARAFFRLDWAGDQVLLLHLHHLALPWDMPEDELAHLAPEVFGALVFVENERAIGGGKVELGVEYKSGQLVFTTPSGDKVAFGDEVVSGRFFRR